MGGASELSRMIGIILVLVIEKRLHFQFKDDRSFGK